MTVPHDYRVPGLPPFLRDGPEDSSLTLVLAHGAGAPMDSPFMNHVAAGLAGSGIRTVRFEFPYMAARREGGKRAPDRAAVLVDSWNRVIGTLGDPKGIVIGGKSMGGRIATMVADSAGVAGLLVFGYPFHPPGRPQQTRTKHLLDLRTPTLILQGTRDALGSREDVRGYELSKSIEMIWIEEGDHSFKPPSRSGRSEKSNIDSAVAAAAEWLKAL